MSVQQPSQEQVFGILNEIYPSISLMDRLQAIPCDLYLYGGFLRDIALGKSPKEADFLLVNPMPTKKFEVTVEQMLAQHGFVILGKISKPEAANYHYLSRKDSSLDSVIDINLARNLEDKGYDFTINSLRFNCRSGKLTDEFEALSDLGKGILRTVGDPDAAFSKKPLLIFRAIKCLCQFDLVLESNTADALEKDALHARETLEYITSNKHTLLGEWMLDNIFRGIKYDPDRYFELCARLHIIEIFLDIIAKKLETPLRNTRIAKPLFKNSHPHLYEYNLSVFFSMLADQIETRDKQRTFSDILELFGISRSYHYHPVGIALEKMRYTG